MAVSYTTLLSRLGRLFDFAKTVRTHQSTLRSEFEDTATNYSDSTRDQMSTLTSGIESRIDEAGRIVQDLRADASKTLLEMMDADTTLGSVSVQSAIEELIRQLAAASQTVDRPASGYVTLPASNRGTAGGSNVGDGLLLLSDMAPLRNLSTSEVFDFPSIRTETIRATCIQDSTSPNVQEGSERFRIEGQRDIGRLDEDWPLGSGTRGVLTVAAANKDGGRTPGVNVCTNSDFENFTSERAGQVDDRNGNGRHAHPRRRQRLHGRRLAEARRRRIDRDEPEAAASDHERDARPDQPRPTVLDHMCGEVCDGGTDGKPRDLGPRLERYDPPRLHRRSSDAADD
jgi:hypothetical protein